MEDTTLDLLTAHRFFARMNEQGVDYAVLRNYERYPSFGHDIDLIVRWTHLPRWKAIARSCAAEFDWNALTECDHWARSGTREHTIQILRFYSTSPLEYLQIDAFHAVLVNSLPLFDEDALLEGRVWDDRGFFRIDERAENFFRLLQIARLAGIAGTEERIARYSERALGFWSAAGDLTEYGAKAGFSRITTAAEKLKIGDLRSYKREIDRQKRAWWLSRMLAHPVQGSAAIRDRVLDYLRLYWLRPCGFTLSVSSTADQRNRMEALMKGLVDANFIPAYTASRGRKERRRVMERGGIVLNWANTQRVDLTLDSTSKDEDMLATLVSLIVGRHPRIL